MYIYMRIHVHIYIHICICGCLSLYVYIYIHRLVYDRGTKGPRPRYLQILREFLGFDADYEEEQHAGIFGRRAILTLDIH